LRFERQIRFLISKGPAAAVATIAAYLAGRGRMPQGRGRQFELEQSSGRGDGGRDTKATAILPLSFQS